MVNSNLMITHTRARGGAEGRTPECNGPPNHDHYTHTPNPRDRRGEVRHHIFIQATQAASFHPEVLLFPPGAGKLSVKGIAEVSANLEEDDTKRAKPIGEETKAYGTATSELLRSKGFVDTTRCLPLCPTRST
jgi:hypothetical protein